MSGADQIAASSKDFVGSDAPGGSSRLKSILGSAAALRLFLLVLGPVAVLIGVGYFFMTGGRYVTTDDARLETPRTWVSTDIPGRVIEIGVRDNQLVEKGQLLFRLNPHQYQIAVDRARGALGSARLKVAALKASYDEHLAELKSAKVSAAYQHHERERDARLLASGIVSLSQFDLTQHAADVADQQVEVAEQQINGIVAELGGDPAIAIDRHPLVQEAQAVLDKAEFDLSNTVVKAPETGIVSHAEQLQVGDYVTTSTPLFSLIPRRIWVEADYRETDLTYLRPGQKAVVTIDTYPGRKFNATVTSVSPGTGSTFSLLPPENATGNWVKVVQRVPVRLALDSVGDDTPLEAGLSVNVEVDTRHVRSLPRFLSWINARSDPQQ